MSFCRLEYLFLFMTSKVGLAKVILSFTLSVNYY